MSVNALPGIVGASCCSGLLAADCELRVFRLSAAHGLSCRVASWDLPGLGIEATPCIGRWILDHQGSPTNGF